MACELLDFRCIFVSELIGSALLTVIITAIAYFVIASKNRWGFDTTIATALPVLLIIGFMISGITAIMAFATILIGLLLAWLFNRILQ